MPPKIPEGEMVDFLGVPFRGGTICGFRQDFISDRVSRPISDLLMDRSVRERLRLSVRLGFVFIRRFERDSRNNILA